MPESLTFCGRTIGPSELDLMRQIVRDFSGLGVTGIARTVCELLEWTRPSGRLKNHECRQLLERLQAEGSLQLPELRSLGGGGPRRADVSGTCPEPAPVACAASECEPLELALVEGKAESRRWREQMERYHETRLVLDTTRDERYDSDQNVGKGATLTNRPLIPLIFRRRSPVKLPSQTLNQAKKPSQEADYAFISYRSRRMGVCWRSLWISFLTSAQRMEGSRLFSTATQLFPYALRLESD